jgi:hypothetical protein
MAYPVLNSVKTKVESVSTTGLIFDSMPEHVAGDLLVALVSQRDVSGAFANAGGWTAQGTKASGDYCQFFTKVAASSSETAPTFTSTVTPLSRPMSAVLFVVKDVDTTTPIDIALVKAAHTASATFTSTTATTATNGCLILHGVAVTSPVAELALRSDDIATIGRAGINAFIGCAVFYDQQQTAGTTTAIQVDTVQNNRAATSWLLCIRNKTGGRLAPMPRHNSDVLEYYGNFGAAKIALTWRSPEDATTKFAGGFTGAALDGVSVLVAVGSVIQGSPGPDGVGNSTSIGINQSAASAWAGAWHEIASTNFVGKLFSAELGYSVATGSRNGNKGIIMGFTDGANYQFFRVLDFTKKWLASDMQRLFIAPGVSTPLYSRGTLNWAAITGVCYLAHRAGSSATVDYILARNALLTTNIKLTGGTATEPVVFKDLFLIDEPRAYIGTSELQGSAQVLAKLPLFIGDGVNGTQFKGFASSLEFPQPFSLSKVQNWQVSWQLPAGYAGLTVLLSADGSANFDAASLVTTTKQPFTIDPASSLSAAYSFKGASFVGWLVNWLAGVPCELAVFADCYRITGIQTSHTCTISGNKETSGAAMVVSAGAVIHICDFTKNTETYALELTAAGAYDLSDSTFTGYTNPLYISATTGTVTITLAAGNVEPGYVSDGATVVFDLPQPTLTIQAANGLSLAGAEIRIYDQDGTASFYGTELAGIESCLNATYDYIGTPGNVILLQIMKPGYEEYVSDYVLTNNDAVFTATLRQDINA